MQDYEHGPHYMEPRKASAWHEWKRRCMGSCVHVYVASPCEQVYAQLHPVPHPVYDTCHLSHCILQVPNFMFKWNVGMKAMFAVAFTIPCFAVWWQQSKAKGG